MLNDNYNSTECIEYPGFYYVPNFINYIINKDGIVFNLKTKNYITINTCSKYNTIEFCLNGKTYSKTLHRLLAIIFIPKPNHLKDIPYEKLQVNHIDLNKRNNSINNLEWMTPKENTKHSIDNGKNKAVAALAKDIHSGNILRFEIAEDCLKYFSISKVKFWKHVISKYAGTLTKDWHVFKLDDGKDWPILQKYQRVENSLLDDQRGYWSATNKNKQVILANTLKELCDAININFYVINGAIRRQGRDEINGNLVNEWLIKYKNRTTPEEASKLPPKIIKNNKPKIYKIYNFITKEESIINGREQASKFLNISKHKLIHVLNIYNGIYEIIKYHLSKLINLSSKEIS